MCLCHFLPCYRHDPCWGQANKCSRYLMVGSWNDEAVTVRLWGWEASKSVKERRRAWSLSLKHSKTLLPKAAKQTSDEHFVRLPKSHPALSQCRAEVCFLSHSVTHQHHDTLLLRRQPIVSEIAMGGPKSLPILQGLRAKPLLRPALQTQCIHSESSQLRVTRPLDHWVFDKVGRIRSSNQLGGRCPWFNDKTPGILPPVTPLPPVFVHPGIPGIPDRDADGHRKQRWATWYN